MTLVSITTKKKVLWVPLPTKIYPHLLLTSLTLFQDQVLLMLPHLEHLQRRQLLRDLLFIERKLLFKFTSSEVSSMTILSRIVYHSLLKSSNPALFCFVALLSVKFSPVWRLGLQRYDYIKMRSWGWVLIQCDWWPQRRRLGHTEGSPREDAEERRPSASWGERPEAGSPLGAPRRKQPSWAP